MRSTTGRGRTWLGLSTAVVSVRPYPRLASLWHMVARSAYIQLNYSPWLLAGTIALGAAIRFATLSTQSFWVDEALAARELHLSFGAMLSSIASKEPNPPLFFIVAWPWTHVFGLSEAGKLFLVVWGVFFTVWLSTHIGVQKVDRGLIRAALMLGTPRRQMLQEIVLLGALPYIVVGLRTAVSISFYTLVAAELAGAFAGIVYRIEIAQQNMQTGQVMGGLAALGLISFIADRLFSALAERTVWWR